MLNKDFILEQIGKHCDLSEDLCEGTFFDMVVYPLQRAGCFEGHWFGDYGVSKGVLIFDDLDFVIKIPFYTSFVEGEYDYDEETGEEICICEGGPAGYAFYGTRVGEYEKENDWDYCETETQYYEVAQADNVEEFFAKTWLLGKVCGWPIYAQAKAVIFNSRECWTSRANKTYSDELRKSARTVREGMYFEANSEWIMDCIEYYGEERTAQFISFCDNWCIDDLHDANIGYVNGAPCIIDYSCYNS